ncbi:hypothetical protein HMPREF9602_00550 [Cutibacterium acnes HL030PA2]|nr:hypothetical protein HMPREF9567_02300 [Cutibacterium acnes HL013PA1]EFT82388.1 hypothetical protein HMPREF9602_00550 [Cutibacterium acnes HL030PA2]EGE99188.1 hypothetical protein HMPREF9586_02293 [Cutibacterium acnes HL083PA2]EGF68442.1 hypothetical protein HMPREF9579_01436 [Cutibacterium acnes HL087PA1]
MPPTPQRYGRTTPGTFNQIITGTISRPMRSTRRTYDRKSCHENA